MHLVRHEIYCVGSLCIFAFIRVYAAAHSGTTASERRLLSAVPAVASAIAVCDGHGVPLIRTQEDDDEARFAAEARLAAFYEAEMPATACRGGF